ncbi:MAG TPA: UDP-N-acetylmuramoyl-L-alanine--D-glutamate ligase [Bryobacteraceae bacterium]|nr:UDP-N-acetylmuramoyl-L-alanine--D-glutamate ligase [Bryobacteraceae bacterium]
MKLEGAKVAVVGMARSGVAAAELLKSRGAQVSRVDKKLGNQAPVSFEGVDLIVLSPGVPADLEELGEARARGVPLIGDLELASWFLQGPIIGITGSNGKTTTTALTGHILAACGIPAQVGGNIGTPPCSMVATSRADQWNVLELSSFQLETIQRFHAYVGACLNITPDHLDRHYTLERYAAAKARLFENQTAEDFAVLNADDPMTRDLAKSLKARVVWFRSREPFTEEVPLRGRHNLENATAAALIARQAGAKDDPIREAIKTFPGVEHRLEFVRELDGVAWYNDSKATNVDAAIKAIEAFPGRLWVILGGRDKNSDYTPLGALLKDKAHAALLIGEAAGKIKQHLDGNLPAIPCVTLDKAVSEARARARAEDTVLLAPACASFDQFDNFEHRGREFKRLVMEL